MATLLPDAEVPDAHGRAGAPVPGSSDRGERPVMTWREAIRPVPGTRYLALLAAAVAASCALVTACIGVNRVLPAYLAWAAIGATIAVVDAHTRMIPNKLVALGSIAAVPLLALADTTGPGSALRAACGAGAAFALYALLNLIAPGGMGMGDVKLAPYLGAHLAFVGWTAWTRSLLAGFLVQAVVIVVLIAARRAGRRSMVAHGPAMWIGALVAFWASVGLH